MPHQSAAHRTLASAAAGLLSGGLAATIHGLHCQETAMPMIAIFHSVGVVLSTVAGAILSSRLLRR